MTTANAATKPKRYRRIKYSAKPVASVPDEASLGPAMKALSPRLRQFVLELSAGPVGDYGSSVRAARAAGLGTPTSSDVSMRNLAYQALHDPRVQEALHEVGVKIIRAASFMALRNLEAIAGDKNHKDAFKACLALVDRGFPLQTEHKVTVEHIDYTKQAIEELRTLRRLGVARERLVELYGADGLFHLERQLDGQMKVIEHVPG
jgi:hypothetical protein